MSRAKLTKGAPVMVAMPGGSYEIGKVVDTIVDRKKRRTYTVLMESGRTYQDIVADSTVTKYFNINTNFSAQKFPDHYA